MFHPSTDFIINLPVNYEKKKKILGVWFKYMSQDRNMLVWIISISHDHNGALCEKKNGQKWCIHQDNRQLNH